MCVQEKQLQSHAAMLQSFQEDLSALQQGVQESRRTKGREVEEHRQKEEYLQHEVCIHVGDYALIDIILVSRCSVCIQRVFGLTCAMDQGHEFAMQMFSFRAFVSFVVLSILRNTVN